ncbi:MAG: hypothetical protein R2991_07170 [Thermoanaerobaculia bacterium]
MSERLDRELSLRGIVGFTVGLLALLVLTALAMWGLARWMRSRSIASDPPLPALREARQPHVPPGPRLQTEPFRDLAELRAGEDEILNGWAWENEEAGFARIPVDRAIDLYLDGERAGAPAPREAPATDSSEEAR